MRPRSDVPFFLRAATVCGGLTLALGVVCAVVLPGGASLPGGGPARTLWVQGLPPEETIHLEALWEEEGKERREWARPGPVANVYLFQAAPRGVPLEIVLWREAPSGKEVWKTLPAFIPPEGDGSLWIPSGRSPPPGSSAGT